MILAQNRKETWPQPSQEFLDQHITRVYQRVRATGVPNEKGAKIPIKTRLNIAGWLNELGQHPDDDIIRGGIQFGFSLQYTGPPLEEVQIEMHSSGENYKEKIQEYIDVESGHLAMAGPFKEPPLPALVQE